MYKVTNERGAKSDCNNCKKLVGDYCMLNKNKPKHVSVVSSERTNCQYWERVR